MPAAVRCRQIGSADLARIADLLAKGFPAETHRFWQASLQRLTEHPTPAGFPKYGYLLDCAGVLVGVVLVIATQVKWDGEERVRCNLSSWYVEPAFRNHASGLILHAMKRHPATYFNVTPAASTWDTIKAQGFSRYSSGVVVAAPALARSAGRVDLGIVGPDLRVDERLPAAEQEVLRDHAKFGCLSIWCAAEGEVYPFVFMKRRLKGFLPCAQLVFCRSSDDLARFAAPIGRMLARRGLVLVMVDSDGGKMGLGGCYFKDRMPKFFKGDRPPRVGDLAYTEIVMFGLR